MFHQTVINLIVFKLKLILLLTIINLLKKIQSIRKIYFETPPILLIKANKGMPRLYIFTYLV